MTTREGNSGTAFAHRLDHYFRLELVLIHEGWDEGRGKAVLKMGDLLSLKV